MRIHLHTLHAHLYISNSHVCNIVVHLCVLQGTPERRSVKGNNHVNSGSYGTLPYGYPSGYASHSSTPTRSREVGSLERDMSLNTSPHHTSSSSFNASTSFNASSSFNASCSSTSSTARRSRGFPMLGKTLLRIRSGKRSSSAPNLGDYQANSGTVFLPSYFACSSCFYFHPEKGENALTYSLLSLHLWMIIRLSARVPSFVQPVTYSQR